MRIVENQWVDSAAAEWWVVEAEPRVDIGTVEGAEEQTLFRVVDAARLSDGRIAVANGGTSQIRYYDVSGTHLRSTGRQGGGPGEFQRIATLVRLGGDSLAVVDGGSRRITLLDGSGQFTGDMAAGGPDVPVAPIRRVADGRWVASASRFAAPEEIRDGLIRNDVNWVMLTPDGAAIADTIGAFPGTEAFLRVGQSSGQIRSIEISTALPFRKTTTVLARDTELYVATQDGPEIRVYGLDGTLHRIVRTGAPVLPVTEEMIARWVENRVSSLPPERREAVRQSSLTLPAGETVPPHGAVHVDRIGRLWVQDYAGIDRDVPWTVYDADGARLARIALPPRFRPFDIGEDWVLGVATDEFEVEHVRLHGFGPAT